MSFSQADVSKALEGLSDSMKNALVRSTSSVWSGYMPTLEALKRRGLGDADRRHTPLGLAVRDELLVRHGRMLSVTCGRRILKEEVDAAKARVKERFG